MAGSVAALAPPVDTVRFNGATMDLVVFSTTFQSQHSYREVERYYLTQPLEVGAPVLESVERDYLTQPFTHKPKAKLLAAAFGWMFKEDYDEAAWGLNPGAPPLGGGHPQPVDRPV